MKKRVFLIFTILFIFLIGSVFAFNFEDPIYGLEREEEVVIFDNTTANVNSSESWVTPSLGILSDVNDTHFNNEAGTLAIDQSWLSAFGNAIWCKLTGCSMTGNINMGNNNITNVNEGDFAFIILNSPSNQIRIVDSDEAQEWRLGSNANLFLIEDQNTGNIPFRIDDGAVDNAITINSTENIFNQSLNMMGNNITNADTITANQFNGLFNWVVLNNYTEFPYLNFNGSTLNFDQNILDDRIENQTASITYNATQIATVEGNLDSGNLTSVQKAKDGDTYNVSEVGGANPLLIQVNFSGVTNFNQIIFREKYTATSGHSIDICLWDYGAVDWECELGSITAMDNFAFTIKDVLDPANHLSGGLVQLKLDHAENGNPAHDFFLDYVVLLEGFSTLTGEETDPFAFHKSGDTPMEGNSDWGGFNFTDVDTIFSNGLEVTEVNKQLDSNIEFFNDPDATGNRKVILYGRRVADGGTTMRRAELFINEDGFFEIAGGYRIGVVLKADGQVLVPTSGDLGIGNRNGGLFLVGGTASVSKLRASFNDMEFGWFRTGTGMTQDVVFQGVDDTGDHLYFTASGLVGSRTFVVSTETAEFNGSVGINENLIVGGDLNDSLGNKYAKYQFTDDFNGSSKFTTNDSGTFKNITILSEDLSDSIKISHDNTNAYIKWDDGDLNLEGTETDANTAVNLRANGAGRPTLRIYNEDETSNIAFRVFTTDAQFFGAGSATQLSFQSLGNIPVTFFGNSLEGTTQTIRISGFRTGDVKRTLTIGQGVDAPDTASFGGVSNYFFDGNVNSTVNMNAGGNITLAQKIIFALGESIDNVIDGWIRINGNLNVTGNVSVAESLNVTGNTTFFSNANFTNNNATDLDYVKFVGGGYIYDNGTSLILGHD